MSGCRVAISALIAFVILQSTTYAQDPASAKVRVTKTAVVLEQPRGDSIRVTSLAPGIVLDVLDTRDRWYLVTLSVPDTTAKTTWERGWIHASAVELVSGTLPRPPDEGATRPPAPRGPLRIRAFAQTGGTLFLADDSFDTILGSPFGSIVGGGAQVVFPNAAFVQVSAERFRETGTRAFVSGTNIFTLEEPVTVTVQPILATVGYRSAAYRRFAPYFGVGLGWHELTEESPTGSVEETGKIGYHLIGGSELVLGRVFAFAGEVQWSTVPKAMGSTGVSALFGEDDLGGTTFRFKLIVGY
jgi:hypothetical protein